MVECGAGGGAEGGEVGEWGGSGDEGVCWTGEGGVEGGVALALHNV